MNSNRQNSGFSFWISLVLSLVLLILQGHVWNTIPTAIEKEPKKPFLEKSLDSKRELTLLLDSLNLSDTIVKQQVGAYIKELRILGPDKLELGGYLWSRNSPEHPDTLLLDMGFDRLYPGVPQHQDQLYYRRRADFHQKSWFFRIYLKDSNSLKNYPFDRHRFQLSYKAPAFPGKARVLLPDFGVYTNYFFPDGIHLQLAGPSQEFSTRDTYFGFSPKTDYSDGNPLSFYFILQRNALRSLLFHMLPLLLIMLVYHMLFWAIGSDRFRIDNGFKRSLMRLWVYGSAAYLLLAYGLLKIRLWDFGPIYLDLIYLAVFVLHIPLSILLLKSLNKQSPHLVLPNLHLWIVPSWLALLFLGTLIWFY